MSFWRYISKSTLKREAATTLMLWLLVMATYVIVTASEAVKVQLVESFLYPIGIIFAGAYGMDWISKQTNIAGPATSEDKDDPK
jgi:hypothetical protein